MKIDAIALAKVIKIKFEQLKQEKNFSEIAKLITYSLQTIPKEHNIQIFGYIPNIFREVEIFLDRDPIQEQDIFVNEPVVYKIYYPNNYYLYKINYFYIFCYLRENSEALNVYFQSAQPNFKNLTQEEYSLDRETVGFEGCVSGFNSNLSFISISDPGQFVPGYASSFYVGDTKFNFVRLIAEVIEKIINLANLETQNALLIGSSAGTFGALLSSTYFSHKVNVLAVNSQIYIQYRKDIMQLFANIDQPQELLEKFGERVSCLHRFERELNSVPNIYILANINDNLYQRNFQFYQMYINKFTKIGVNNQSVFDSYYGVDGHGRPETSSLKTKIRIAREVLTMKSITK